MKNLLFLSVLVAVFASSCATQSRTTMLGMGVGAGTGAITGAITEGDGKGVVYSGLAFAFVGALAGFFSHEALEKRDERVRKEAIFKIEPKKIKGGSIEN